MAPYLPKFLFIFSLLISATLFAQKSDSLKFTGLHFKNGKWRLNKMKVGRQQVEDSLQTVALAMAYYKKGRTNRTIAIISILAAVPIVFLAEESTELGSPSFGKSKIGFKAACFILSGGGLYEMIRFGRNFKKAARIYNEKKMTVY